ncbi:site-specific integrase [Lacinutrix sp. 5H-3-7-4]|uniref:tyrosine-type recombinase/integrase n=1 Tax=Lacinutrix sp. (strain 5H-3-7-4) TaxID=983544 RepID=UPI00020A3868|nr:site-specific integrase [Lacinutrix sp. 5H-3-7-4]AEH00179.1 integrase family protein [Lacinutrix sp. 5H-3-7-4]
MSYNISIRLDNRRKKKSGMYPIKLRVYGKETQKEKWYNLDIDLTEKKFQEIWLNPNNKKLRGENKELRLKLQAIENRANDEASKLGVFDFKNFEFKLFRKASDKNNLQFHFNVAIENCIKKNKINTAESFKYTLNSLATFSNEVKNCPIEKLKFQQINVDWLRDYEAYMVKKGKSYTTIAIYTRTLRVIFNNAIEAKDLNQEYYPFGKSKYQILRTKKVKKALNSKELKVLFDAKPANENESKAKDFWFFSFACNGINPKDIALLKYSDIKDDKFTYYRAKTFDKKAEKTEIIIYLTDFTNSIIEKYGSKNKNSFVFDILNENDDANEQHKKIKNFTRYINDHIKRLAVANKLPSDISFYYARHSFATNSLRKGASMEFISEALNHSDLSVTKNYFAGFEDEAKKEFANSIMNF